MSAADQASSADPAHAWCEVTRRLLGMAASPAPEALPATVTAALAGWQLTRTAAVTQLQRLEVAIRGMHDPQGDAAIILVRAIAANLTAAPRTLRDVDELERYLRTDDIVTHAESPNGFGITIALREPLLAALGGVRAGLAPRGREGA